MELEVVGTVSVLKAGVDVRPRGIDRSQLMPASRELAQCSVSAPGFMLAIVNYLSRGKR
jgi:hypothetical protein